MGVLSQCGNTATITLKAGNQTIFETSKKTGEWHLQVLNQGHADLTATEIPKLTITVNEATQIKPWIHSGAITDQIGKKLGYTYNVCLEDSNDDDYNDIYVNVAGWARKG